MTFKLSTTFLVCCSLMLPQSVPWEPGRSEGIGSDIQGQNIQSLQRRFPPEIRLSIPAESFARGVRTYCAHRSTDTQSVSFRPCPPPAKIQLILLPQLPPPGGPPQK